MAVREQVRLKVREADQRDVGKGVIRFGMEAFDALGIHRGDVVEIEGKRTTAAVAVPLPTREDVEGVARLDGLLRTNAGIGLDDFVEVRKVEWKPARRVTLAPAVVDLRLAGSGEALRPTLAYRPLVQGDLISTSIFQRGAGGAPVEAVPDQALRRFMESPAFGLMEMRMLVVSTLPKGVVRVTEDTEIELLSERREADEVRFAEVTYEDLGGLKPVLDKVREMIELPLKHPELFDRLGIDPPRGILLHGPPGTGKTLLAKAVAHESEASFASLNGPEIMGALPGQSEARLRHLFEEAERNAPSILFIDELDSIAPKRSEVASELERRIVAQLLTLMDGLKSRRNVIVIAATNRIDAIDPALRRPGRFDREIALGIPDESGRLEILQIHSRAMPLGADADLRKIAAETHGHTGSDLAALVREAAMAALRRLLPSLPLDGNPLPSEALERLSVDASDFEQARRAVQPSALRETVVEIPKVRWSDIGGLDEVKRSLHERVELPLRRPDVFTHLGVRAPKGVLLYGPPGTGKTMLAKAVATEAGANFLTVKGSALLSKWYGESEKKISELFARARQVTPAILFLDELDSLAPVRGASLGDSAATERIVNQLLAEMDGMEELHGVMVLGATNRPDMIDPALLRPGRFDELLFVSVPDKASREAIFRAQTATMRLAADVDLAALAARTERFTGADIAGICLKAGLLALRRDPEAVEIRPEDFDAALRDSLPSVTEEALTEYERIGRTVRQQSARIGFR